ncbi:MAG: hypothetical protein FWG24_00130 [Eggerthellaceae bacterium]|nr:hypothetical protein [Eggerthellaceae bacterium]
MFNESKLAPTNGSSATISIKDWLLLDLLLLLNIIPIIGSIACLVIYLIIGFGKETAPSMKNRVIMTLIWCAISIVLSLLGLALGGFALIQQGFDFSSLANLV